MGIIRAKDGKIIPGIDRDWRNPKDYEFTQSLNPHQWAWEFLRRNPEYRKDWQLALEEYLRQYPRKVIRIRGPGFAIHSGRSMEKWGITAYTNPEEDNPREVRFLRKPEIRGLVFGDIIVPHKPSHPPFFWMKDNPEIPWAIRLQETQVAAIFNLDLPLKPQFRAIKKDLEKIVPSVVVDRHHQDNWCIYLMILDAKAKEIANREIAEVLFLLVDNVDPDWHGSKKVYDTHQQAKKLMDGDYIRIISPGSPKLSRDESVIGE
jgi:hypothetical protein